MTPPHQHPPARNHPAGSRGNVRVVLIAVLVVGVVLGGAWLGFFRASGEERADVPLTPPLARGALRVTVMESGSLDSLQSVKITNKVEGRTTVDYIIPEGTILTQDDVDKGTVLVRVNTAEIDEKITSNEIEVTAAADSYKSAGTDLEIQIQKNASDLRKADLDVRFAHLDLARYVGAESADRLLASYHAAAGGQAKDGPPGGGVAGDSLSDEGLRTLIASLLDSDRLEGEALQTIRSLKADIQLADEEHRRAAEKLKHSVRLEGKGYVSREDLEADKLALERRQIEQERSRTARDQYVTYDFPKEVQTLISGVAEAEDRRSRVATQADAEADQKRSAMVARERQWNLKQARLEKLIAMRKDCEIKASVPGLVVYASSGSGSWRGNDERIDEGASIREGQTLIQIPDANSLGVIIKVHETAIDKVREGLEAWVEVDAAPGQRFPAHVREVSRMPDAADRWMNPDLKVYTTKLQLLGDVQNLKPGMSAQVEIHVTTLQDVLSAPVQAVGGTADEPAVFVWKAGEVERRKVVLGLASEHFVEIKSGVAVGERLLLDPPREERPADGNGGKTEPDAFPTGPAAAAGKGMPDGTQGEPRKRSKGRPGGKAAPDAKTGARRKAPAGTAKSGSDGSGR